MANKIDRRKLKTYYEKIKVSFLNSEGYCSVTRLIYVMGSVFVPREMKIIVCDYFINESL